MHPPLEPTGLNHPLDHVAIAVNDLEEASKPYLLLGMEHVEDEVVAEQGVKVRMLLAGDAKLELLQPIGPDSPVARFLDKRGEGLHHVALRVPSVDAEVTRLRRLGAEFTSEAPRVGSGGSRIIFLHPSWTGGVLVELVERRPHGG